MQRAPCPKWSSNWLRSAMCGWRPLQISGLRALKTLTSHSLLTLWINTSDCTGKTFLHNQIFFITQCWKSLPSSKCKTDTNSTDGHPHAAPLTATTLGWLFMRSLTASSPRSWWWQHISPSLLSLTTQIWRKGYPASACTTCTRDAATLSRWRCWTPSRSSTVTILSGCHLKGEGNGWTGSLKRPRDTWKSALKNKVKKISVSGSAGQHQTSRAPICMRTLCVRKGDSQLTFVQKKFCFKMTHLLRCT